MSALTLHLLTAVTRPDNLGAVGASVAGAVCAGLRVVWHLRGDPDGRAVGGQALKNAMLDEIADGWVYILDDDNLLHPGLPAALARLVADRPEVRLAVVAQELPGGAVRRPAPDAMRVDGVDAAQLLIRRDAIGGYRIPETYAGDGMLAAHLAAALPAEQVAYLDEPLAYYNRLRA